MGQWLSQTSQKNLAGETAKNSVRIMYKNVFVGSDQFVLEFLQNAEDARFELCNNKQGLCNENGIFRIKIFKDRIIIENNGKNLDKGDINSLCTVSQRKRPSIGYKGFIGIGWKSVFKISSHIDIASKSLDGSYFVSFQFSRDAWGTPYLSPIINKFNLKPDEVVWELTPIPTSMPEDLDKGWTRFTIFIEEETAKQLSEIVNEKLRGHMFLFLKYINRIEIEDNINNVKKIIEWSDEKKPEKLNNINIYRYKISEKVQSINSNNSNKSDETIGRYIMFSKEVKVPDYIKNDNETKNSNREDVEKREVSIAFELDTNKNEIRKFNSSQLLGVYSFMPLDEVESGLYFLIQADFIIQAGRKTINYKAKWNKWLMEEIANLLNDSISYLKENYITSYPTILDYDKNISQEMKLLLKETIWNTIDILNSPPSKLSVLDNYGFKDSFDEVFKPEDQFIYDLIKEQLINDDDLSIIFGKKLKPISRQQSLSKPMEDQIKKLKITDLLDKKFISEMLKRDKERTYKLLVSLYSYFIENRIEIDINKKILPDLQNNIEDIKNKFKFINEKINPLPENLLKYKDLILKYRDYLSQANKEIKFINDDFVKTATEMLGEDKAIQLLKDLKIEIIDYKDFANIVYNNLLSINEGKTGSKEQKEYINPEDLPLLTLFVFNYYRNLNKIWMLRDNGELTSSKELYSLDILEKLGNSEEVKNDLINLGIKFVDKNKYLQLFRKEDLYQLLSNTGVHGLDPCNENNFEEFTKRFSEKAIDLLKDSEINENNIASHARYVKYIKDLYNRCKDINKNTFLNKIKYNAYELQSKLQLLDLENKPKPINLQETYCLLSASYGPKENWSKWLLYLDLDELKDICFVSDTYLNTDKDKEGWKDFLTNALKVREDASDDLHKRLLGSFGQKYVIKKFNDLLHSEIKIDKDKSIIILDVKDVSKENLGYDILLKGKLIDKELSYFVEVKSIGDKNDKPIFTENEKQTMIINKDKYIIALVTDVPNNPKIWLITADTLLRDKCEKGFKENIVNIINKNNMIIYNVLDANVDDVKRLVNEGNGFKI
jgi:hypothetical protein